MKKIEEPNLRFLYEQHKQEKEEYKNEAEKFWNGLSKDDQLKAFYSVCKRIHKAELIDGASYRTTLYDVFGFGLESYTIGMDCGYMNIHNAIDSVNELLDNIEEL